MVGKNEMHIPGYTIEREIGHGGMATVYLAEQQSLGRKVALKVMSAALAADRSFSERFIKEARTVAHLSHPNIVAIHDVGIASHVHYLALEFISGGDLKDRIRHSPMQPFQALPIIREVARALGYAHDKGFVHRDVSPENILFRDNGSAVLTDFGIARGPGSGTRMTGTGMAIGKPHYMSPEQARGKETDGRADIYALGIVLYEMLTGKVPYDAEETLAIGIMHVTEPVPELPAALSGHQSLLDRMLAKDPDDRFRDAEELVDAIDNHDPTAKPRNSGPRKTEVMPTPTQNTNAIATTSRNNGVVWALAGSVAAVAVLGGAYVAYEDYQNRAAVMISGGGSPSPIPRPPTSDPLGDAIKPAVPVPVSVSNPSPEQLLPADQAARKNLKRNEYGIHKSDEEFGKNAVEADAQRQEENRKKRDDESRRIEEEHKVARYKELLASARSQIGSTDSASSRHFDKTIHTLLTEYPLNSEVGELADRHDQRVCDTFWGQQDGESVIRLSAFEPYIANTLRDGGVCRRQLQRARSIIDEIKRIDGHLRQLYSDKQYVQGMKALGVMSSQFGAIMTPAYISKTKSLLTQSLTNSTNPPDGGIPNLEILNIQPLKELSGHSEMERR